VAIGPAIAAKTGLAKDTWLNILETKECTISAVTHEIVHRMNLTSGGYPPEVDEFEVAGFTKRPSVIVAPPSVAESPYSMECKLMENIELRREVELMRFALIGTEAERNEALRELARSTDDAERARARGAAEETAPHRAQKDKP
jgi:flavin reductase (DIM6/NTAB) family NADH-FMN oxidoreductase RutF